MDKESIIDELFGAIAGLFLFYGISPEKGSGKIITDLLKRVEELLQRKTAECEILKEQTKYVKSEKYGFFYEEDIDKLVEKEKETYEHSCKNYKEVIRLTAECENARKRILDLEDRIMNHAKTIDNYCSRLADKRKECEELKKEIADLKTVSIMIDNNRYKQALDEISSCIFKMSAEDSKHYICNKILDIIDKAKEGENE